MNTICKIADIDIYLLYFLKIKPIFVLSTVSKDENELISKQDSFREMQLIRKENKVNKTNIIDLASLYGYISILDWMDKSVCKFMYDTAIENAACNGHTNILEWFDKSNYKFKYCEWAINKAARNGARRRSRFHRDLIRRRRENA